MPLRLVFLGRLEDVAGSAEREVTFTATLSGTYLMAPPLPGQKSGNTTGRRGGAGRRGQP